MMNKTVGAVAAAALLSGAIFAATLNNSVNAQTAAPTGSVSFTGAQATGETLGSELLSKNVLNAANEDVGDVNDLVFGTDGRLSHLIIGVGGFAGIGEKDVAVPFDTASVQTGADGKQFIRLDVTKDALQAAPTYKRLDGSQKLTDRIKEWGKQAGEKASEYTETAKEKAAEYGEKAKEVYNKAKEQVTGEPQPAPAQPR